MLGTLIVKDFQRLRANWRSFVILLCLPMGVTALLGAVFGPASRGGGVPQIKLAIVDEDENLVGNLIASAVTNEQARKYLDPIRTDREEAFGLINQNKISAVIVIPQDFTSRFLSGEKPPPIRLVKNPAQSYMPAITEELLRVVTEVLNAISVNLTSELPQLIEVLEEPGVPDTVRLTRLLTSVGKRFERAEPYLFPPVISYQKASPAKAANVEKQDDGRNIFAFVLPGLVAMFLLFVADGATRDLFLENRQRTLDRYRTHCVSLWPFFAAKALYAYLVVILSAVIMLGAGAFIFGIRWQHMFAITALTGAYAFFCVGFAYALIAVIAREQLASTFSTVIIMLLAFLGGSMMPAQNLPPFLRNTVAAWMPNYLFADGIKVLQFGTSGPDWRMAVAILLIMGTCLFGMAVPLIRRRLTRGAFA